MADIDLRIVDKLLPALDKPKRIKIIVGGRGSAKSIGVGDIMLMFADHGERVCCAREFQNSIDDSVHESLKQEIDRLGVQGFTVLNNEIRSSTGGELFYKGLARNITSLKSLAGVKKLWIEEGESVSEKSLKVLTPSIRSSASSNIEGESPPEIWITMNRGSQKDAVAKKYLSRAEKQLAKTGYYEDDLIMVIEVNWQDNPWFPPELEQERQDDEANLSAAEYRHIWGGAYYDEVPNSIIKQEWFDAAIDAHVKLGFEPRGVIHAAFDPADCGDCKGFAVRHGVVVTDVRETNDGDTNTACDWALDLALEHQVDAFTWDYNGIGSGLARPINDSFTGKQVATVGFMSSETPESPNAIYQPVNHDTNKNSKTNRKMFKNKRAQGYWRLRDRFYKTFQAVVNGKYIDPDELISLSSDIEMMDSLRSELCRIPRKFNGSGTIQIVSKEDMRKPPYELESPGMSDCLMMQEFIPDMVGEENAVGDIEFNSLWN